MAYKSCACFLRKFCVVFLVQVRASLRLIIYLSQNLQFVSSFLNRSPPLSLRAHRSCWTTFYAETSSVKLFLVTLSGKTSNCCGIIPRISAEDCFRSGRSYRDLPIIYEFKRNLNYIQHVKKVYLFEILVTGVTQIVLTDFCVVSLLLLSCSSSITYNFCLNNITYLLLIIFVSNSTYEYRTVGCAVD
jgi:hypothetical protein